MLLLSLVFTLHRNLRTRKAMWRHVYQLLMGSYQEKDWTISNYGYDPLGADADPPALDTSEELGRSGARMYHHVASPIDLKDLCVLEVGSGRGGGSAYIKRVFRPRLVVGVDLSQKAVSFCAACHPLEGLAFIPADAEALPFRDASFDAVVNVESSHCYPSMATFVAEVTRVLRPGGFFLYADFRHRSFLERLEHDLQAHGLRVQRKTDITPNVLQALALDNPRRVQWVRRTAPRLFGFSLAKLVSEFWGVEGSRIQIAFREGKVTYQSFVLKKAAS